MAEILVRTVTVLRIDVDKYLAAAQEDVDHSHDQEDVDAMRASLQVLAEFAGERDPEELVPRWAFDAVIVESQDTTYVRILGS